MSLTKFKAVSLAFLLLFYLVLGVYLGWVCREDPLTLKVLPTLLAVALAIALILLIAFVRPMHRAYTRWLNL